MKRAVLIVLGAVGLTGALTFALGPTAREQAPPEAVPAPTAAPVEAPQERAATLDRSFSAGDLGVVLASSLNVRSAPGRENARVGLVRCGDVLALTREDRGWYQVEGPGVNGWSYGAWIARARAGGHLPECGREVEREVALPAAPVVAPPESVSPPPAPEPAPVVEAVSQLAPPATALAPPVKVPAPAPAPPPPSARGAGPESIRLSQGGKAKAVTFPHHMHNAQYDCAKCHHPVDGGAQANAEKACHSCHARAGEGGASPVTNKDAFHRTCQDCHKAEAAGPTQCAACHTGA